MRRPDCDSKAVLQMHVAVRCARPRAQPMRDVAVGSQPLPMGGQPGRAQLLQAQPWRVSGAGLWYACLHQVRCTMVHRPSTHDTRHHDKRCSFNDSSHRGAVRVAARHWRGRRGGYKKVKGAEVRSAARCSHLKPPARFRAGSS